LLSFVSGYLFAQNFPKEAAGYLQQIKTFFDSINQTTPWQTFLSIFQNNVDAMLMVVALGIFVGFFSLTFLSVNGFMLGVVAQVFLVRGSLLVFALGIIPHGLIEIPCMIISASIGFKIGMTSLRKLFHKKVSLTNEIAEGVKFAATVIVPFLALAAFIETYITPYFIVLAQMIMGA
jgi:stage II sporulation protein M